MALVRILVDGYSLLHEWQELAPGKTRFSEEARDELIYILTQYHDVTSTPITVFFDGSQPSRGPKPKSDPKQVEVLFSRAGQTADSMIERAAHLYRPYGEVLAVTDDHAERDTVIAMGGLASSCQNFIRSVRDALAEVGEEIRERNLRERNRFNRRRE